LAKKPKGSERLDYANFAARDSPYHYGACIAMRRVSDETRRESFAPSFRVLVKRANPEVRDSRPAPSGAALSRDSLTRKQRRFPKIKIHESIESVAADFEATGKRLLKKIV